MSGPAEVLQLPLGELTIRIGLDEAIMEGPGCGPAAREIAGDPASLWELARFDANGRYRPLSGARGLPGGWFARFSTLEAMAAGIEAVYPLAQDHISAFEEGRLRVVPLEEVLGRQAGRYEIAASLSPGGRAAASAALCGRCVRVPTWRGVAPGDGEIPCPEACSVLVALCREAATWESGHPARTPLDPSVPFAAFDLPGNEVREHCLALMEQHDG